jgi:glycosidase
MKKISILVLILSLLFTITACQPKEYEVVLDGIDIVEQDDLYRVYYEIFVGAFSDSNKDGIGDLRGIINRLDYLNDGDFSSGKSLGVTGLWLMPIMKSPSYHKYDVRDYKSVDPSYGTLDDFKELAEKADERGINIIIDLVLNHTSVYHEWFRNARDAVRDGDMDSPYLEYYTFVTQEEKIPGRTYYEFEGNLFYEGNFSDQMPELNMDSDLVRQEIISILEFWFDLGVSGFRLDATKYVYYNEHDKNVEFWNWFMTEVKKIKPDAYVVGETWSPDIQIATYYESFSNFDFGMAQSEGMIAMTANAVESVNSYVTYINQYRNLITSVREDAILQPFISNHDMNRAAGYLSVPDGRMQMAANLYIWTYGTPFLYYGEEIGMKGSRGTENTDANRRLAMLWGDKDNVENPAGSTYDSDRQTNGTVKSQLADENSIYNHYKKVILLREANPEIARGTYTPLEFDGYQNFGGFLSTYQNSTVGVFHNTGMSDVVIDLSLYTNVTFEVVRGYAGQGTATLVGNTLTLSPLTSVIIK